jgi:acyl-CoA synthetase (AMP-forming)/AMP-acid ligase II
VVTPASRLSYARLLSESALLARRLITAGVGKGTRVGIMFPNNEQWVIAWAAAARIGAVTIPVNTFYKGPELGKFLRHSDIQVLLGVGSFLQHDYVARLTSLADPPVTSAVLPQLRRVIFWDEVSRPWASAPTAFAPAGEDVLAAMEADVVPGDELLVTYTSGSTGEPKGVIHSHGTVIRHAVNLASLSSVDATSRIWTPMPLCWVGGFAFSLIRGMSVGGAFLTQEVFDPASALPFLSKERVTIVAAWPAACKQLASQPDFPTTDLSSMKAGALYDAIPSGLRAPDPALVVGSLGMSETCGPHTFWSPSAELKGCPPEYKGTFGREVPGVEHKIIDPDTGAELPEGVEGEVLVRGYSLMLGMYKRERGEVFDPDGWYHTGDRGYFRDGWFFFTGRQSDLIKTAGSNVAPAEVEAALLTLPGVKLAFVVGVPHPDRGEDVVAMVVPWDSVDTDALREALREQLSSYKVPRAVLAIGDADVPWLASQKADRRALGALAAGLVEAWQTQAPTH